MQLERAFALRCDLWVLTSPKGAATFSWRRSYGRGTGSYLLRWLQPHSQSLALRIKAEQKNSSVVLKYLGTAGWEITDGTTVILIDPYLSRINGPAPPGGRMSRPIAQDTRSAYRWQDIASPGIAAIDAQIGRADFVLVTRTRPRGHQILAFGGMNYIERELAGLRPDVALVAAGSSRREIYDYSGRLCVLWDSQPLSFPPTGTTSWPRMGHRSSPLSMLCSLSSARSRPLPRKQK